MRRLAALALPALLSCNPGFDPQYRVTDLRILAVRAEVVLDPADTRGAGLADPNLDDALQLEALIANPRGNADLSDVDVTWLACRPADPGTIPPCVDPTVLQDPASLVSAGAFPIAKGPKPSALPLSALPPEVRAAFQAQLDSAVSQATSQPTFRCRVYFEIPVVVVAQSATGRRDVALKRIRLVESPPPSPYDQYSMNHNPEIKDPVVAPGDSCSATTPLDAPAALRAGAKTTMCVQAAGDPKPYVEETYNVCGTDGLAGQTIESYTWQWYVTAGEFADVGGLGNAEGSHLDFTAPKDPFTLWLIVRDGRGGETWSSFILTPAP